MSGELTRTTTSSLVDVSTLETLSSLYSAWEGIRLDHLSQLQSWVEERQRLEGEAAFLLGTVRAASQSQPPAVLPSPHAPLVPGALLSTPAADASLQSFLTEAEARLSKSQADLRQRMEEGARAHEEAQSTVQARIQEQLQRYAARAPPPIVLYRRPVGKDRAVLHVERMGPDAALELLHLTCGKLAARYDFLTDDRTESKEREPTTFYAEAGDERPPPARYPALCRPAGPVSPVKGFIPLFLTRPEGTLAFFRLLQRGAVLEAEILDGEAFRSILARDEAELLAGQLLRWKLAGALQLRIEMG